MISSIAVDHDVMVRVIDAQNGRGVSMMFVEFSTASSLKRTKSGMLGPESDRLWMASRTRCSKVWKAEASEVSVMSRAFVGPIGFCARLR